MHLWSIIVLVCILSSPSFAKDMTLPTVTVSAEPVSSVVPSKEEAKAHLNHVAGATALIDANDYKKGRATTPQDMLGFSPGIFIQQRDTGAQESRLSIRGSGLQRTFHLRGVELLQDGIPLNQADGSGDFYKIEPLAVDYTEVFRGGNALRYGAATLGGAVNFVSPTGYTADKFQARAEGGSFGYIRSQVSSGAVVGKADYYVSLSQFKQQGFRDHTSQDNHYEFANVGYRLSDSVETRLYISNAVTKANLGGGLTKTQLNNDPRQAAAASVSGNQKRDVHYSRVASKTTVNTDDQQQWDFSLYMFNGSLFHPIFQVLNQDSQDYGAEVRYIRNDDMSGHENRLTVGFSPSWGYIQDHRFANVAGARGSRSAENDQEAYNLNLYAEDEFKVTDHLSVIPGVQMVYARRQSTDYYFPNGDDSGKAVYRAINPKAGITYDVTEGSQAFFGYTRGFEPPTFSELFDSASNFLANKAQRSHTWETGLRGHEGIVDYDATYYYSILDKELLSLSDTLGNPLGTVNARGKTVHQGIELAAKAQVLQEIYVRGIYNLSRLRFDSDDVYGNNPLPSLPEHVLKAEVMYEHAKGFYVGPNVEWSLSKYPIDMANTFFADPYHVWGFKAGYKMKKGFSLFIEGKNLADKVYAASTGIVNNANGMDTNAVFNPGNGRAFYAGVEYKY